MILKPPKGILLNREHPLAKGLVGCWLMNEGSGNKVFDLSGNGNVGTFVADAHFVGGKFGPAVDFDGTGDYIQCNNPASLQLLGDFTISFWMRPETLGNMPISHGVWSNPGWYTQLNRNGANTISFVSDETTAFSNAAITNNAWQLVTIVYKDSISVSIYINGVDESNDTSATNIVSYPSNLTIGAYSTGGSNIDGQIDNVLVYNRALTVGEVAYLYREPFTMFEREPIELWTAAQGAATVGAPGAMTLNTGYWGPTI